MSKLLENELSDYSFEDLFEMEREIKQERFIEKMKRINKNTRHIPTINLNKLYGEILVAMHRLELKIQPEHFDTIEKVVKATFVAGLEIGEYCAQADEAAHYKSQKRKEKGFLNSLKSRRRKAENQREQIKGYVKEIRKSSRRKLNKSEIITRLKKNYGVTLGKSQLYEILKNIL